MQRAGNLRVICACVAASLFLTACGGGGGGGGGGQPNAPQQPSISIGGTVSGLASGASVVLQNNGQNPTTVTANGAFTFTTLLAANAAYAVTVATQPSNPLQTCVVANGSGTAAANVSNVAVTCTTNAFPINVAVTGLQGSGLVMRNGTDSLNVTTNGTRAFPTLVASGGSYSVSVQTNPVSPSQTCSVSGSASGTVASAPVTVNVVCSTMSFPLSATVTGLAGSGLILQNNGGNNLAVSANGTVAFASPVASGATFNVTVQTNPSNPTQTCVVTGGSGTITNAPVSATVTCTTVTRTIGGTVTGLAGTGLQLTNNGGNALSISANGDFTFTTPIASGAAYAVAVSVQPTVPTQACTVANGSGTVVGTNITNVAVNCVTSRFTVGGTISGLAQGGSVVLQNNAGDNLTVSANGSFTFATPVISGGAFAVTALSNATRVCTPTAATGTVVSANITTVVIRCRTKFAYLSNEGGTRSVSSYTIGANGGFTNASSIPVSTNTLITGQTPRATGVALTPSGGHVIVASDADNSVVADGELQVFSVNANTGALTFVSATRMGLPVYDNTFCGNLTSGSISCGIGRNSAPETVVIHPNGRFVYVMDGVARGACNNASAPCNDPRGGNRVIVRYSFDPATGTLTFQDRHYVEGFTSMAIDARGRFIWGTSFLERQIFAFRIDQTTGALTFSGGTFIGMTNGDMQFGIDPNGNNAYVSHFSDLTIDAYTIDQTTGRMINIGSINGSCASPAVCNKVNNVAIWSLAVAANGRALYGSTDNGTIVAFALGTDGSIGAPLTGSPYTSATPLVAGFRSLLGLDAPGQFLYQQDYNDTRTRVFSVNATTGVLTEAAGVSPTSLIPGGGATTQLSVQ
jgi:6-phosphogluconolactonase (cycloisomerase 2 family)